MDALRTVAKWVGQVTEVGLALIALGIVIQILFGENATFLTGDIVGNLINLIRALGENGLVGLIALGIILYLYNKSRD